MSPSRTRSNPRRQRPDGRAPSSQPKARPLLGSPGRPSIPLSRIVIWLPLLAFLLAVVFQVLLRAAGLPSTHPLRIFATPLLAAAVVLYGLRGRYPTTGRIRLAVMVAVGLFLFALLTQDEPGGKACGSVAT